MRTVLVVLVVLALIAGSIFLVANLTRPLRPDREVQNIPATATVLPPARIDDSVVVADGRIVPVQSADLSLPVSGFVSELMVRESEQVEANQLLLRLKADRQAALLAEAQADLRRAEARYQETVAGAREQEILAARAQVDAAQAQLDKLQQGSKAEDIQAAQASLAVALAEVRQASSGTGEQELIAAKADLDNADATRRRAQAAYDRVAGNPDIGRFPEALELEKATNEYNAALARYEALQEGPDPDGVAAAQAKADRARAELNALRSPPSAADIAAAEAEIRRAQAELDLLLAGPRVEEISAALADVAAAEAAVARAEAELADTELFAPFAGEIVSLENTLGQQVAAGELIVRMADLSGWRVETADLTELDVVGVQPGDPVSITFDAIPGLELPGTVLRVKPLGENKQGDITYTVVVLPDRDDDRLLWNMTATLSIDRGAGPGMAPAVEVTAVEPSTPTAVPPEATPTPELPAPTATPGAIAVTPAITADIPTGVSTVGATLVTVRPAPSATAVPSPGPASAPVPAATAGPTRSVTGATSPPDLLAPDANRQVSGNVTFQWQPTGPLPDGASYEVVWWNRNEDPAAARGIAPPTTDTTLRANVDVLYQAGQIAGPEMYWTVLIVGTDPYQRLTQPAQSVVRVMNYEAGQDGEGTAPPPPKP